MHILQLNTEKGWRGGERQTLLSMVGLREAGVPVTLLCLRDRPLFTKAVDAGFPVIGVCHQIGALLYLLKMARHYTVLHAQSSRIFGFAAGAKLFVRTPLVYTRRVDFVPKGAITRWKYRKAAALVAISVAIKNILHDAGMGEATVISSMVSPYTPDVKRCATFGETHCLEGRVVVGVIAALVGHKDPCTMIRAAAAVRQKVPNVVFLHFGEGHLRSEAEAECARLGLGEAYRLEGHVSNVEDFFSLFSCFAMSSTEEGLGSTVLDAFRFKVPVASTAAGGLKELVDGRGLLSPPGDAPALAGNILRLLDDSQLARKCSDSAAAYVNEYHGCETLTRRYIDLYKRVSGAATP